MNGMEIQTSEVRTRRKRQGGQEIIEFALMAFFLIPIALAMFDTGMNLIKSLQASQVSRDLGNIYIHGGDFSTYSMQQLAQRLAYGMNLQFPAFGTGVTTQQTNTGTAGDGVVWVTKLEYVGPTSGSECQNILPASCANHDSFVYTEQMVFGSSTVAAAHPNQIGNAVNNGATLSSGGIVQNPLTSAGAKLPGTAQTAMTTVWQTSAHGQSPLTDGTIIYAVEVYFQTGSIQLGPYSSQGIYSRSFF